MKAYKATYNMKCRNQLYEVGKTYSSSKLEICKHGFHYCDKMEDTLSYYDYNPIKFILMEVEILGNVVTQDDKSVTDEMKVLRIVSPDEYNDEMKSKISSCTYDDAGNMLTRKNSNGYKESYTYDDAGNMLTIENSNGRKASWTYDDAGNTLTYVDSNGYKESWTYDDAGNKLTYEDSYNGCKESYTYDDAGNMLTREDSNGRKVSYDDVVEPCIITVEE